MSGTSSARLHRVKRTSGHRRVRMALLPDLASAVLYGVVVFLLVLGFLVVFVETVPTRRLVAATVGVFLIAVGLASTGEAGAAFLAVGVGAALVANHAFEWLTTR